MITRSLVLSVIWLLLSSIITYMRGTRLRHGNSTRSTIWLISIIVIGDLWALSTFGKLTEVLELSSIALLGGFLWIHYLPNWNGLGQTTWTMSVFSIALFLVYSFTVTAFSPLHPLNFVFAFILFSAEVFGLCLSLSFIFETLDVCTRIRWNHRYEAAMPIPGYTPKVSIHIPAYNEPPELVEATLRALAQLDYPNFEVILVDNNTPEEDCWRSLVAVCRELGSNFRCLHLDNWPGYKSGALNFALTQTAPDAEIISIVDADYKVQPEFLRETVPYFFKPEIAFLQTPQDYREYKGNAFLEACYIAYKYFFEVSMVSRNEHNAIIFGGTMGLIRKSVLQEIGGWDEWCITEDSEASLRILKLGYESVYMNHSYGHGIMPLNFEELKKQRFRWCFGGVQILRKHWEALMPWSHWMDPTNRLTLAQRYYYLAACFHWFNELVTLVFTLLLIMSGLAYLFRLETNILPLGWTIALVPLVFLILSLWRFVWALRHRMNLNIVWAMRALSCFFSFSWVVTLASIQGLIQPRGVFLRTPKLKTNSNLMRALRVTTRETGFGIACALTSFGLILNHPSPASLLMIFLLLWQANVYLAAPVFSLISVRNKTSFSFSKEWNIRGHFIRESRAARWAIGLGLFLLLGLGMLQMLPRPQKEPVYARLKPIEFRLEQIFFPSFHNRISTTKPLAPTIPSATPSIFPGLDQSLYTPTQQTRLPYPSKPARIP